MTSEKAPAAHRLGDHEWRDVRKALAAAREQHPADGRQVIAVAALDGQDCLVWAQVTAIDGPVAHVVSHLLEQKAAWSGGWATLP